MSEQSFLVATDVETTGLDPAQGEVLLEIFVYVLEDKYPYKKVEEQGFHRIIKHDPVTTRENTVEFVQNMHDVTGLWDKLAEGTPVDQVDTELLEYLQQFMKRREGRIMGNSIRLDMNFLDAFLPKTAAFLHYRSLDVSGLAWFAHTEFDVPYYEKDASVEHTAKGDIEASIQELRHIQEHLSNLQ